MAKQRRTWVEPSYLPEDFGDWADESAFPSSSIGTPVGFLREMNEERLESVRAALNKRSLDDVLRGLAKVFECDPSQVCLVEECAGTRVGQPISITYMRFGYNADLNGVLKRFRQATFERRISAWRIAANAQDTVNALRRELREYARVVVDLTAKLVLVNAEVLAPPPVEFEALHAAARVERSAIETAIQRLRPGDGRPLDMQIHNGETFVAFPSTDAVIARVPRLLIRYSKDHRFRRYGVYEIATHLIDKIMFDDATDSRIAMAEYRTTCRRLKISAFVVSPPTSSSEREI
jgi:hypothetical protein